MAQQQTVEIITKRKTMLPYKPYADYLLAERQHSDALSLSAALKEKNLPLALAALSLYAGLGNNKSARLMLEGIQAATLSAPSPALPNPDPDILRREMWLRGLCAYLQRPFEEKRGSLDFDMAPTVSERLSIAKNAMQKKKLPGVIYALWQGSREANLSNDEKNIHFVSLHEAFSTLLAHTPHELKALSHYHDHLIVLEGVHTLTPHALQELLGILDDAAWSGINILVQSAFPDPWGEVLKQKSAPHILNRKQRQLNGLKGRLEFHAHLTQKSELLEKGRQAQLRQPTLLLLPSRRAALESLKHFPQGILNTRSKTAFHLGKEKEKTPDCPLVITTWSGAFEIKEARHVLATPLPLPLLSEVLLTHPSVELIPTFDYACPSTQKSATQQTVRLLKEGRSALSFSTHQDYWESLLSYLSPTGLQESRRELEYTNTSTLIHQLFESGVHVLIDTPQARKDIQRALNDGLMPLWSPFTAVITQDSFDKAKTHGLIEQIDEVLIWRGQYSNEEGIGLP